MRLLLSRSSYSEVDSELPSYKITSYNSGLSAIKEEKKATFRETTERIYTRRFEFDSIFADMDHKNYHFVCRNVFIQIKIKSFFHFWFYFLLNRFEATSRKTTKRKYTSRPD